MRTVYLLFASIFGATAFLILGYVFAGLPWIAVPILFIGAFWAIAEIREWRWVGSISLSIIVAGAAIGIILELDPIWAIVAAVLALAGWEFGYFRRMLKKASFIRNKVSITQRHNTRVIAVAISGIAITWMATQIEINIGFGVALLLAVISLLGLSRAVLYLRRSE